jgi:D-proline reductase (dithiol) PrdB
MCHQTVGLLAGLLEQEGIATVCLSLLPEVTDKVQPPRVLPVDYPLGYPLGAPHQPDLQRDILRRALSCMA